MKIVVFGAGAWGTALALSASTNPLARHRVSLCARDAVQAADLQSQRENVRYLTGIKLPASLTVCALGRCVTAGSIGLAGTQALAAIVAGADLLVIATPMAGLRSMLIQLRDSCLPVAWLCKGFEVAASTQAYGLLAHEVQAQVAPDLRAGGLSGPSFALEVAQGKPTALVAASGSAELRSALVEAFHGPTLRVYANDDLVGVEVGGAVKNVLAIAAGLCDGLQLGLNARAALITRGLAEMTRLGVALGARAETFMGLSGLGDLVLTTTGDLSRNRQVGLALAQGQSLQQVMSTLGHVAEGVYCARTVLQRAGALAVEMPITQAVVALLDGQIKPQQAVALLMEREPVAESA